VSIRSDHANAGLVLLDLIPALPIYDGAPPPLPTGPPEPPYVVVHTSVARPPGELGQANTINARSLTYVVTYSCHCVGLTARAARAVQGLVGDALTDVVPTVAGRACGRIKEDDVLSPDFSSSTGRDIYGGISIYSYISAPG
jgi:hypothetical protein